jgi:succinate dehydrogenase / fumarate reductase, cytochrome b subunit
MSIRLSNHFLARRLHSLSGVVPIGAFLLEHFYTNFHAVAGATAFNDAVKGIQGLLPGVLLPLAEAGLIGLPILFHAVYGLYIAYSGKYGVASYNPIRNWNYVLQRATGIILFIFILSHVLTLRFGVGDLAVAHNPDQSFSIVERWMSQPLVLGFYVLGIFSAAYHLANGLWTFAIVWGITVGAKSQRVFSYACAGLGVIVFAVGIGAATAFVKWVPWYGGN